MRISDWSSDVCSSDLLRTLHTSEKAAGQIYIPAINWGLLAMGAMARGTAYLHEFPGFGGKLLMIACSGSVFLASAKIFDCLRHEKAARAAAASPVAT